MATTMTGTKAGKGRAERQPQNSTAAAADASEAVLYRMVMPQEHICPYGLKSLDLLKRRGFEVDDQWLTTRSQTEAFKREHGVDTTPQTFIAGKRIGGYDDLRRLFGLPVRKPGETRYAPVLMVFAGALLAAAALSWQVHADLATAQGLIWFVSLSMLMLAVLKLRDLEAFSNQFLGYDLLAQRWVPYAYVYPFAEALAALGMMGQVLLWPLVPLISLFIGAVGACSVVKAVYVDKRELKCACVGGNSEVPLGAVSLTENLMMVAMGLWMLLA